MFVKNKNIIFKIRRSKVTDYAALRWCSEITALMGVKRAKLWREMVLKHITALK